MTPEIETIRTIAALRARVTDWRRDGQTVGVVPTMGALHAGHLALVAAARERCTHVIVTLFVNPMQFDHTDDLATYPRTEESDKAKLAPYGVDVLFAPDGDEIYPPGFATTVHVTGVSEGLCGGSRQGHFDGVATVVSKLLLQASPDIAFFGEKDFQQLQVVKRMVLDLNIPVEIAGIPTVREDDGLALSSRNAYLTAAERRIAPALFQALNTVAARLRAGEEAGPACADARETVERAGFHSVDYLEVRAADGLAPLNRLTAPARVFAAAWLGKARLIDNIPLAPSD